VNFLCLQNCDIFDTNTEGELTLDPTMKKYCKQGTEFYSELTAKIYCFNDNFRKGNSRNFKFDSLGIFIF
jgi:hypothetical protein